jgi:AcrR family transcriptional regulator
MNDKDKRSAILDATLKLISERGFHDTPMSQIAKEAGVSAGIIYHYFENKEDLICELFGEVKMQLAKAAMEGYSEDLPLRERFRLIWLNTARFYLHHPSETAFLEQFENSPYYSLDLMEKYVEYYIPIFEVIQYAVGQGVIKDLPLEVLSALTLEVAISLAKKHTAGMITLDEEAMEAAMEACWDAVKR